jgi:hypothetical protein
MHRKSSAQPGVRWGQGERGALLLSGLGIDGGGIQVTDGRGISHVKNAAMNLPSIRRQILAENLYKAGLTFDDGCIKLGNGSPVQCASLRQSAPQRQTRALHNSKVAHQASTIHAVGSDLACRLRRAGQRKGLRAAG